jgi:hypothetical protein
MAHLQGELLGMLQQAVARDLVSIWCAEVCGLGWFYLFLFSALDARSQQVSSSSSKECPYCNKRKKK